MRETVGSLRTYLVGTGLLGGLANCLALFGHPTWLAALQFTLGAMAGAAYLYLGLRLRTLLVEAPKLVTNSILAGGVYSVVGVLRDVVEGNEDLFWALATSFIVWYLYHSAKRLAIEAATASGQQ
jgi:hypothetical protein